MPRNLFLSALLLLLCGCAATQPHLPQSAEEVEELTEIAKEGDMRAQRVLGDYYAGQKDVGAVFEAAKWYALAAERGSPLAQHGLARLYETGRGVARDQSQAAKWYTRAAESGHTASMCALGALHYHAVLSGAAPTRNRDYLVSAHFWYSLAVRWGAVCRDERGLSGYQIKSIENRLVFPGDIATAEQMAREWNPPRPPQCAVEETCIPMAFK